MPVITTKPVDELQRQYAEFLDGYEDLIDEAQRIIDEINYGPDVSDEGQTMFDDFRNALTIIEAAGRLIPDEIPDKLLAE